MSVFVKFGWNKLVFGGLLSLHLVGTKVWLVSNVFVKINCGVNPIKVQFPFATIIKFNAPAHNLQHS